MDLNLPYYIGKGVGKRANELKRNKDADDVTEYLLKNGIRREVRIVGKFVTHKEALNFEIERIAYWWYLKDHDVLTNKSKGGEGPWGYKHGPEQLDKMSKASKGKSKSPEHCNNISNGLKGRDAPWCTGENHWMHGKGFLVSGENNPMYGKSGPLSPAFGKPTSEKQKAAVRKTGLKNKGENNPNFGKVTSDEVREKLRASNVGKTRSEEAKVKMRKPRSPEGRAAIAASNRARAEKKRSEKQEMLSCQ